jgi:hypothetical protein
LIIDLYLYDYKSKNYTEKDSDQSIQAGAEGMEALTCSIKLFINLLKEEPV